jgi:hypothetical protein
MARGQTSKSGGRPHQAQASRGGEAPRRRPGGGACSRTRAPAEDAEGASQGRAGRRKIKRQYEELLGIRVEKLKGRILNRERINKTIEGIYFICASCRKICHNLDEGLVEDPNNLNNLCHACANVKEPRGGKGSRSAAA